MLNLLKRVRIEAEDRLRWHPAARQLLHRRALRKANRPAPRDPQAILYSINQLCRSARLAPDMVAMQQVEGMIHALIKRLNLSKVNWSEWVPDVDRRRIEKAVVLKPRISPKEKGVVFVSFEGQWARLLWDCRLDEFAEDYMLVIAPSWTPPHSMVNCLFPAVYRSSIFCLISNTDDLDIFPRLSNRYVAVPLFASNWVNPGLFKPVPLEKKDLDIVMVANFAKFKRHFLLFKALRDVPPSVRVLLIGQEEAGRGPANIIAEAQAYGVQNRFALLVNAPHLTVLDALSRAKISVVLSRREGSGVAVVESMFANTPVGMFEDAEIGSRVYINECTGRFLTYRNLSKQLMDFIASAHKYSPRVAAEKNISCVCSTKILNDTLKRHALAEGYEWTQDIALHHWRPNPELLSVDDRLRMQAGYDDIEARFGIVLGTQSGVKTEQVNRSQHEQHR